MTSHILRCRIRVGKNGDRPRERMWRSAERQRRGAVSIQPWAFRCLSCGCEWGDTAISVGCDLKAVSCSNCYSDDVLLTAFRIEIPERHEVRG